MIEPALQKAALHLALVNDPESINKLHQLPPFLQINMLNNLPTLLPLLADPSFAVRRVIEFLGSRSSKVVNQFISNLPQIVQCCVMLNCLQNCRIALAEFALSNIIEKCELVPQLVDLLVCVLQSMLQEQRAATILHQLLDYAQSQQPQVRKVTVQLFSKLAVSFQQQICEAYLSKQLLALGQDQDLIVRRYVVQALQGVGKVVGTQFFRRRLQPFLLQIVKDRHWAIRKAVAQSIADLAVLVLPNILQTELRDALISLLQDQNKLVKLSAFKNLGKFIVRLNQLVLDERLLDFFCLMPEMDFDGDQEVAFQCAYYFPQVLNCFQMDYWKQLSKCYDCLANKQIVRVRQSLAASLTFVGRRVTMQVRESTLVNTAIDLLVKGEQSVKALIAQVLGSFIKLLDNYQIKLKFIEPLLHLKQLKAWRSRQALANCLFQVSTSFLPVDVHQYFLPTMVRLCSDGIATVRISAGLKLHQFLINFRANSIDQYCQHFIEMIIQFSTSASFLRRQMFLFIVKPLLLSQDPVLNKLRSRLLACRQDRAASVRTVLAEIVSEGKAKGLDMDWLKWQDSDVTIREMMQ